MYNAGLKKSTCGGASGFSSCSSDKASDIFSLNRY